MLQTTDGRTTTYSEREFTFAKNEKNNQLECNNRLYSNMQYQILLNLVQVSFCYRKIFRGFTFSVHFVELLFSLNF